MRLRLILLSFLLLVLPTRVLRAEALAPAAQSGSCLRAAVDALRAGQDGLILYRIVFINRCDAPRSFVWCAESPAAQVPAAVACPQAAGGRGFGTELRYAIQYRKEFQWSLPPGARVRFHDCPAGEVPGADFACAAPAASRR
jgi:hypothetical protein